MNTRVLRPTVLALALLGAACSGRDELPAPADTPAADTAAADPGEGAAHAGAAWGYEGTHGPEHWAEQYPSCGAPDESPIDLAGAVAEPLPPLQFDYQVAYGQVRDTGHSIQVDVNGGTLVVGPDAFTLTQLHFHLPSEHTLAGRSFDGEVHFVHRNAAGEPTVVAVFLEAGAANRLLSALFRNLPDERDPDPKVTFDPGRLLPEEHDYFTYAGSMTTPPCTGGVRWIVMETPVQVSGEQLQALAAFHPINARPPQALGERTLRRTRAD